LSYILEALKKLEQKRQHEGIPNLLTLQSDATPVPKRRFLWIYVISGIVLLNLVVIGLLFRVEIWKSPPPAQTNPARENTSSPLSGASLAKHDEQSVDPKANTSTTEKEPLAKAAPKPSITSVPPKTVHESAPSTALSQSPPQSRPAAESAPRTPTTAPPNNKIVPVRNLPADIKAKLTELKMTVHSYNEQPQLRFAVINNITVRESQSVHPDLKVEQITQNGVVLNCQGYRFFLGINETP